MIKYKFFNLTSLFFIIISLSACVVTSGIKPTNAIVAPGANTKLYRTYSWYQPTPVASASYDKGYRSNLHERITNAMEAELEKKGYKKVSDNPDVLVAYDVSVSVPLEKDNPENFEPGFGYSYAYMVGYRYNYKNGGQPGYRSVDLFKSGTLIIDLIKPKSKQLVWRGWTEGALDNFKGNSNSVQQHVQEILNKL